jgi:hypothetical protein
MAKTSSASPVGIVRQQGIPVTNPKNIEAVYSNQFGVSATMTDFTIYFLELSQEMSLPKKSVQKQNVKAIVTLPLMAAPGLMGLLQQMMQGQAALMHQMNAAQKAAGNGKK